MKFYMTLKTEANLRKKDMRRMSGSISEGLQDCESVSGAIRIVAYT